MFKQTFRSKHFKVVEMFKRQHPKVEMFQRSESDSQAAPQQVLDDSASPCTSAATGVHSISLPQPQFDDGV